MRVFMFSVFSESPCSMSIVERVAATTTTKADWTTDHAGPPQQNGRHERMHPTLKREATKPAAANVLKQQARFADIRRMGERIQQGDMRRHPAPRLRVMLHPQMAHDVLSFRNGHNNSRFSGHWYRVSDRGDRLTMLLYETLWVRPARAYRGIGRPFEGTADQCPLGSIRSNAPSFSAVSTYSSPSGPSRTSRIRWCRSRSNDSRRISCQFSLKTIRCS